MLAPAVHAALGTSSKRWNVGCVIGGVSVTNGVIVTADS